MAFISYARTTMVILFTYMCQEKVGFNLRSQYTGAGNSHACNTGGEARTFQLCRHLKRIDRGLTAGTHQLHSVALPYLFLLVLTVTPEPVERPRAAACHLVSLLTIRGSRSRCYRYFSASISAICTAFSAAPLRMLSATTHRLSPYFTDSSLRMRPTKVSSLPAA